MNTKPHVVLLNKAFPPWIGGIEKHVHDIGAALAARGWRVTALVCNDRRLEIREKRDGMNVIRAPQWMRVFSQPIVHGYFRALQDARPDLVHVHVPFPLGWFSVRHIHAGAPLVSTWHSDIIRQRLLMPFLWIFQKRFLDRCNRIIPTSQPLLDHSKDLQPYRDKCSVIPLALPPADSSLQPSIERHQEKFQKQFPGKMILFVGRLVGYKGLSYLIEAMQQIEANLCIAGDGALKESLRRQCRKRGVESKVVFLGSISEAEKYALYRTADVFALPSISRNEAFGYVLLEAMEQGCPVISTDLPTGVQFVNRHEESGFVVPSHDAHALAHAIQQILQDAGLRNKLSHGARERIRRLFRFESMIDQLENVYEEALQSAGSSISTLQT
ncbi:MAG: glycosyltransferase [Candidatus Omnitrophica bacterium]|nr:glycosyltransferase [Candidatus Omnitrophota bacterium]